MCFLPPPLHPPQSWYLGHRQFSRLLPSLLIRTVLVLEPRDAARIPLTSSISSIPNAHGNQAHGIIVLQCVAEFRDIPFTTLPLPNRGNIDCLPFPFLKMRDNKQSMSKKFLSLLYAMPRQAWTRSSLRVTISVRARGQGQGTKSTRDLCNLLYGPDISLALRTLKLRKY